MCSEKISVRPVDTQDAAQLVSQLGDRLNSGRFNDLVLYDMCQKLAREDAASEKALSLVGAWREDENLGLLALRPVVTTGWLSTEVPVLEQFVPSLGTLRTSLLKAPVEDAVPLWELLAAMGFHSSLEREETSHCLMRDKHADLAHSTEAYQSVAGEPRLHPAVELDFESLVWASRASLIEEGRPDTYQQDPMGFRHWVRERMPYARVLRVDGEVVFTVWADVALSEGWLAQGVYTWPEVRRHGFARRGMAMLCDEAFSQGADHVQLSVVTGNRAAEDLYSELGFDSVQRLHTVLFS
ncbi:MAG: GNAT family N-acetyltransferase [Deltaproteobacteria bacterium]|nr:GNAT family N-acetyltransferase [Deltaproteobacteria bacterium]